MSRNVIRHQRQSHVWMLLALLTFILQPLGSGLFCHEDPAHDHSTHAAGDHNFNGVGQDAVENHHDAQTESGSQNTHITADHLPAHPEEICCSSSNNAPAVPTVTSAHSSPSVKDAASMLPPGVLSQVFLPFVTTTARSRAGPSIPTIVSQLRRSSLLNRAPPLLA